MIVNKSNISLLFFQLCLCSKLIASLSDNSISSFAYLLYQISAVMLIGIAFLSFMMDKKNKINKILFIFIIQVFLFLFLYGIIFINTSIQTKIYEHIKAMFLFYSVVFCVAINIKNKKELLKILESTYYCLGIIIIICFVRYFDNLAFLSQLSSLFSTDDRYRWAFGFYHENFVGNLSVGMILTSFLVLTYKKQLNKNKKIKKINIMTVIIIDLVSIIMLLSSASRSNFIALLVFGIIYLFLNIERFIHLKSNVVIRTSKILILIIACIIMLSGYNGDIWETIFKLSNRSLNFIINIPTLLKSGRSLIGLGYVDAGMFGINALGIETFFIDNYFLYMLMATGLVGLVWSVGVLIYIFTNIKDSKIDDNATKTLWISIFITYIVQGLFETCIFYPTFVTSYVYLIAFIAYIGLTKNRYVTIRK